MLSTSIACHVQVIWFSRLFQTTCGVKSLWLEKQAHKYLFLKLVGSALLASIVLMLGIKTEGNFGK